jgi:transposase
MPSQPSRQFPPQSPHTKPERQRVLEAYRAGRPDWMSVAASNGFPKSSAYDLVARDRSDNLKRGEARAKSTKVTAEVLELLESYLNENCTFTTAAMATMLFLDIGLKLSTTTISRHLLGLTYTIKQIRVEPSTCNNDLNKAKRQTFAKKLLEHQAKGNYIVYYDETN